MNLGIETQDGAGVAGCVCDECAAPFSHLFVFFLQIFKFSGKRQHYSLGTQFVVMTWRVCEINEKLQNYAKSSWFSVFSLRLRSRLWPRFLKALLGVKAPSRGHLSWEDRHSDCDDDDGQRST